MCQVCARAERCCRGAACAGAGAGGAPQREAVVDSPADVETGSEAPLDDAPAAATVSGTAARFDAAAL